MAASTWTWFGGSSAADIATNWTLTAGPGNINDRPDSGDTAIVPQGTVVVPTDAQFNSNTVNIGGTAGVTAAIDFVGDNFVNFGTPTLDGSTLITNAGVPGAKTGEATVLDAAGTFINQGSIIAEGTTESTFTINIHQSTTGSVTAPGFFINYGEIIANAGNTMTIAIGGTSELFNVGLLEANGGTLVINANPAAIVGGYAPVLGVALVEGGGTIEIDNAYPSGFSGAFPTNGGSPPYFVFGDAASGDTLKIDQVKQFGGRILGFQKGNTIDIGTSLSVGKVAFDATAGVLALENASGTILASLGMSSGAFQNGTFDVSGGVANHITIVTTASDTFLTTDLVNSVWDTSTGSWQTKTSWSTGKEPDSTATPVIGLGASAPFTIDTGATTVSTDSLNVVDHNALLKITSNMTVTPDLIQQISGTIEVTGGNTLLTSGLRQFERDALLLVDKGTVLDLTGHVNTNLAANNGTLGIGNGNTVALFVNGSALVDGGTIVAGPNGTQVVGGLIDIGQNGPGTPGTMTVQNGGTVFDTYANLSSDPTSNGALTLTGAGTRWIDAGDPSDTQTTRGFMIVGGNNQSSNGALPPFEAPAQLTVENGAALTETAYARIAASPDSGGSAFIGFDSIWTIGSSSTGGFLTVGQTGTGSLEIFGGTVDVLGGTGTFMSNGTVFTGLGVGVGNNASGDGTITIASGTLDIAAGGMGIGKAGHGFVDVQNNGTLTLDSNGFTVGQSIGATGTMFVEGLGALFTTKTSGGNIGLAGDGTLEVLNGGTVALTGGGLDVGVSAGATGLVEVAGTTTIAPASGPISVVPAFIGSPALLTSTTNGMTVGQEGAGTLEVLTDGTVTLAKGINVAATATATGTILVSGVGAELATGGGIDLGHAGSGLLTVDGDGLLQINSGGLALGGTGAGAIAGAKGIAVVQGATVDLAGTATFVGGTIAMTGNLNVWAGSTISVDAFSAVGVGVTSSLTTGELTVGGTSSLTGDGMVNAAVLNNHSVAATTGGTLEIGGGVLGTGVLFLNPSAVLRIDGSLGNGETVAFASGSAPTLILAQPGSGLGNTLNNVSIGDRIELGNGMTITAVKMLTPGTITNASTAEVHFHGSGGFPGTYDITNINFAGDGSNFFTFGHDVTTGDDFIQAAACFAAGTRIGTERGEVAVEALRMGDRVHVVLGQQSAPVIWIGHRHVDCSRQPDPRLVWPVRVSAGAFGPGRPNRDLWLSPDHAVYIGDVLIPVKCLINGSSIAQVPKDAVTYYHVELQQHSVLLAEGLPTESYLDTGDRSNFANGGGPITLHPDFSSRVWEAAGCAPLVVTGPALAAARDWVNSLAAALPRSASAA